MLATPSPEALCRLINICEEFSRDNDIVYNQKKTKCMFIKPKRFRDLEAPPQYLYGHNLEWVPEYKYLGVFITNDMLDDRDIRRQTSSLYARGNMLIRKFCKCSPEVKLQLFNSYVSNMYCSYLWKIFRTKTHDGVRVAYNNVFRILMSFQRKCSISSHYVSNNVDGFMVLTRKLIVCFRKRLLSSDNIIIKSIVNSAYFNLSSQLSKRWQKIAF